MNTRHKVRPGLSIVEMAFVLLLMALLAALPFFGMSSSRGVRILQHDAQTLLGKLRVAQALAQNPSSQQLEDLSPGFSLSTHAICGYGIHFNTDQNSYVMFADVIVGLSPTSEDCTAGSDFVFDPSSQDVLLEANSLSSNIVFDSSSSDLRDVVFQPPYLEVHLNGGNESDAYVDLFYTGETNFVLRMFLNSAGQISLIRRP